MREILFRGKTKKFGNWIEGSLIVGRDLESGQLEYFIAPLSAYYTEVKKVIPETVGQYTGLVDKNVTKIFEGNIVKCISSDYIGDTKISTIIVKDMTDYNTMVYLNCSNELEVIGNIHDNPEVSGGE